jgi:hypothetical protein
VPNSISKYMVGQMFQASVQTIFEFRFRLNSLKFSVSFFLWYPKAHVHSLFVFFSVVNVAASVTSGSLLRGSPTESASVSVCDLGTSTNSHPNPPFGCSTTERK